MRDRLAEIDSWLRPVGEAVARAEASVLLDMLGRRQGDERGTAAILMVYGSDLADLPAFALTEACRYFRRDGESKWIPVIADLRRKAKSYAQSLEDERKKLIAVLDAQVLEPVDTGKREEAPRYARETADAMRASSRDLRRDLAPDVRNQSKSVDADEKLEALRKSYASNPCKLDPETVRKVIADPWDPNPFAENRSVGR